MPSFCTELFFRCEMFQQIKATLDRDFRPLYQLMIHLTPDAVRHPVEWPRSLYGSHA